MIRQKILQQLLEWIECNLEHPISIEDIAQKSGYSRRNIQLLFRNFMHVPLGEYIRKRRLCRAAILVRLTAKSMLDIALSLHFDSQQSFSREFKKLFGCSPREYRHRDYWDLANIFPSFLIRQQQKTECRLINFPETPIFGNSFKYDIEVSNKSPDEEVKLRRHHLARCMKNFKTDIYFVSTFEPSTKSVDLLTVETFAGTVCKPTDSEMPKEWTINRGLYDLTAFLCKYGHRLWSNLRVILVFKLFFFSGAECRPHFRQRGCLPFPFRFHPPPRLYITFDIIKYRCPHYFPADKVFSMDTFLLSANERSFPRRRLS